MKQNISYSGSDYAGSVIFWIVLIFCACFFFWIPGTGTGNGTDYNAGYGGWWWWFWIFIGILCFFWFCALLYTPTGVYVDDDEVRVKHPIRSKRIRMSDIESAEPYQVSAYPGKKKGIDIKALRIGNHGKYYNDHIGEYEAYYNKPENTVLIKTKDGKQYVIGGSDAKQLADYINSKINK